MGWGKILGSVASLAAAPFTGGTSLAFLPALMSAGGELADTLGGAAKGSAQQGNNQDQLKIGKENARLGRDKFALDAPRKRMDTGMLASLAQHASPSSIKWGGPGSGLRGEIPQLNGGVGGSMRDATADPRTKALTSRIMDDELMSQMKGGSSAQGGGTDTDMGGLKDVGESSKLDKILGSLGLGSSILGALGKMRGGGGSPFDGIMTGPNEEG